MNVPTRPLLPPELTDEIIYHLRHDLDALSSASLVCKSWFPAARSHLFHVLKLGRVGIHPNFLENLKSPDSIISPHVQRLHYISCDIKSSLLGAQYFTNVESLGLYFLKWADARYLTLPAFPRLKKLDLSGVEFRDWQQVESLIRDVPLLQRLSLRRLSFAVTQPSPLAPLHHPSLRVLAFDSDSHVDISPWFTNPHVIKVLIFDSPHISWELYPRYLLSLGPSLEHLVLKHTSERFPRLDLVHDPQLLTFEIWHNDDDIDDTDIVPLIDQIAGFDVENVVIRLELHSLMYLSPIDWDRLDEMLTVSSFPRLRTLMFQILSWDEPSQAVDRWIREILPECESRGILQIIIHDPYRAQNAFMADDLQFV